MAVFIANFGRENYEWSTCLARNSIATMNAEPSHQFWLAGDRKGYINWCLKNAKTASGTSPTPQVASRWFNLMSIISESVDDVWIHREKDQLWWTRSLSLPATISREIAPIDGMPVFVCHKPCEKWSANTREGRRLEWKALHPKAQEFLFTEGTLQQLSEDNAAYALALIEGNALSHWHDRPLWRAKIDHRKRGPVTIFTARQKAVARMAMTAFGTAASSNGQQALRTIKNKEISFTKTALEEYLAALIRDQEGLCALTGLSLQFDGEHDDTELLCSLDRIDSDGHYAAGNLQVVCKFANRWKSDSGNNSFRRLIAIVRQAPRSNIGEDV